MTTIQAKFEKARNRMVVIRHSMHYEAQKEREIAFRLRRLLRQDRDRIFERPDEAGLRG